MLDLVVMQLVMRLLGENVLVDSMVQMMHLAMLMAGLMSSSSHASLSMVRLHFSVVSGFDCGGNDGMMKFGVYVDGLDDHGVPLMVSINWRSYL